MLKSWALDGETDYDQARLEEAAPLPFRSVMVSREVWMEWAA